MTARNPTTFLIGAGPVATALAGAMRLGGVPVLGLWARKAAEARYAGSVAGVAAFSSAPPDLLLEAEIVIVAVSDAAIADVATMLLGTGLVNRRHVLLHCSGAFAAEEVFEGLSGRVGGVGTLHPLSAIADAKAAMRTLKGTVFGVEGDERGATMAGKLASAIGGIVLPLSRSQMAAYHAAAAIASNYVVAAIDAAAQVIASTGMQSGDATAALLPLAEGALRNIVAHGTTYALTGPVRRGDAATVQRHLEALRGQPELAEVYRVLARHAVEMASRIASNPAAATPDPAGLDAIRGLLKP